MMLLPTMVADGTTPEAVTFKSKTGEGTYQSYALTSASRGSKQEEASQSERGKVIKRAIPWRLWASDLAAVNAPVPKHGDQLMDANSVIYIMDKVNTAFQGQVFNCDTFEMLS